IGRAYETEMVRPYGVWIDALGALDEDLVPADLRPGLGPLLPRFGGAAAADRSEIFDAVLRLVRLLAQDATAVIAIDDLQWLDDASAALLHFIARSSVGLRTLIVTAARPAELEENPAAVSFMGELRRARRLRVLEIDPLDADQTARLVHAVLPDADAARVFADSGGNPLFALEEARALAT